MILTRDTTSFVFKPSLKTHEAKRLKALQVDDAMLKNEPMLFGASMEFARWEGGALTRAVLDDIRRIWPDAGDVVIDSRVHMLMPGWYPCIPGWHHDDVARGMDGQPDYDALLRGGPKPDHLLILVNSDVAPTEFYDDVTVMPRVSGTVYGHWNTMLNQHIERSFAFSRRIVQATDRTWHEFDCTTFHRGVKATRNGWRWFLRASKGTSRVPTNEVRRQVQVYLDQPEAGW
jgi:hypothetical protein